MDHRQIQSQMQRFMAVSADNAVTPEILSGVQRRLHEINNWMVAESTRKRGERREGRGKVCGRKKVRLMVQ